MLNPKHSAKYVCRFGTSSTTHAGTSCEDGTEEEIRQRATPAGTATGRSQGITSTSSRIRSRRNAGRNISWVFTTGSSAMRDSARAWLNWVAVKKYVVRWTNWRTKITHTTLLQKNWCAPKQLVDPFEFLLVPTMLVRHRADFKEALSTLRRFKNQEDQAYCQYWWQSSSSSWWNLARFLVVFFFWASPRRRPALIDQGNLLKSDWGTCSRYDSQSSFGAGSQFKIQ